MTMAFLKLSLASHVSCKRFKRDRLGEGASAPVPASLFHYYKTLPLREAISLIILLLHMFRSRTWSHM
jgi:hypothetical protein